MSSKYKFYDQEQLHFVTFAVVGWIDLFIRHQYKQILLDSRKYCIENKGLEIYGWCIMTSHLHMIVGTIQDKLENIMRDMKRHTSGKLRACIKSHPQESRREWMLWMMERAGKKNSNNLDFQLWRQDNHPLVMDDIEKLYKSLDYIHNNPVEAGIVEKPEDYLYSSARDYYGIKGMVDIKMVEAITV